MLRLAQEAEVSLITPYNLLGSKSSIFYALLNDSLERLDEETDAQPSSRPVAAVLELAGIAADVYTRDGRFYRPLMQFLLGSGDPEHRPRAIEQGLERWRRTLRAAVRGGLLPASIDQELLARQLMISFVGALEFWIHEELDDDAFRAQSLYGSTLLVLANALPAARPRLVERLRTIERRLPRRLATPGGRRETRFKKRRPAA
jgi:AcrR family transcriptional regulator